MLYIIWSMLSHAASFDCAKAQTPSEKLICSDPTLSKLDEQLAVTYKTMRAQLTKEAQNNIKRTQREWLRSWPLVCSKDKKRILSCAQKEYQERISILTLKKDFFGSFSQYTMSSRNAKTAPDPESYMSYGSDEIIYPLFNNTAQDPAITALNTWIKPPKGLDKHPISYNNEREINITHVGVQIIKKTDSIFMMAHGAAHPNMSGGYDYFYFSKGRPLAPKDLFTGTWEKTIAAYAFKELQEELQDSILIDSVDELQKMVASLHYWNLSPKGVTLEFDQYEVAPYVYGPLSIPIPKSIIAPYLTPLAKDALGN